MNKKIIHFIAIQLLALTVSIQGQVAVPGDGSDGTFNPQSDVEIDLSQAVIGTWDASNAVNAGKGIYDPEKWAVVFKYSSVDIPEGVKVTFKNHPSRPPVVWLVSGDVSIAGELNLDGEAFGSTFGFQEPEGGPGGFRGGAKDPDTGLTGSGFGPGGGKTGGAAHAYNISSDTKAYGNAELIPLIGGSGGAAWNFAQFHPGGGGGGAILIAARNSINIDGIISARGGNPPNRGAAGSGGSIRLISDTLSGDGKITVRFQSNHRSGADGRLRFQANDYTGNLLALPGARIEAPGNPPQIWPDSEHPTIRILSVDGVQAPVEPLAEVELPGADIELTTNGPVEILIETKHMPINSALELRIAGRYTDSYTAIATYQDGDEQLATWRAEVNLPTAYSSIRVVAIGP